MGRPMSQQRIRKPIVLIIRDGWGINPNPEYNAVANANTPNIDLLLKRYPNTELAAAGTAVGLPEGYQGSSEVGHLNMGAGRIVEQELKRINDAIASGIFFQNANFQVVINNCLANNSSLHLMGLVQDEGVHAHQDHLFAIMKYASQVHIPRLYIHFFADGRDTPPRSALGFYRQLKAKIAEYQIGEVATIMGRYYAMDRVQACHLTRQAYDALTRGDGIRVGSVEEAIQIAYTNYRTPDDTEMTDEYIPPFIIGDFSGIKDGDSVIHFNYRQDRAIQLTKMFVEDELSTPRWKKLDIAYCGLTRYYDEFPFYILEPMDEKIPGLLGEVISKHNLKQLRISETQKFRHVTSFFNGKLIEPFPGEERIEIKSSYDPALYASHPEMNAFDVTREVIRQLDSKVFDFVVLNYANCDMVGHTGDYEAAKRAVEVVDECVGKVVDTVLSQGGIALVTADHGNAEEMMDLETGSPKPSHTKNPVEFIYVADNFKRVKLRPRGILSDIAPTVLYLLGLEKSKEMTSNNLIVS